MIDVGLTHIALPVRDIDRSVEFYAKYASMQVVHRRGDGGSAVAWISDKTRPFVIVLVCAPDVSAPLRPWAHLGVGCATRDRVDELCREAERDGVLLEGPKDSGPPVGYWAFLEDPDGHTLELSFGQEVGLAVEASRG